MLKIDNELEKLKPSILNHLKTIVDINSNSENINGNNEILIFIKNELINMGFYVEIINQHSVGATLVARNYSELHDEEQAILLLGHSDTVFPDDDTDSWAFTTAFGKCYGPGVLDMKGGLSQIIFALKILKATNNTYKPVKIIIASDEENGHLHSDFTNILKQYSTDVKCTLCCESGRPDGAFVIGRKGVGRIDILSEGIEAHAGYELDNGVNAILNLTSLIEHIQRNKVHLSKEKQHFNLGKLNGGTEVNVVPGHAKAEFDVRFFTEQDFTSLVNWVKKNIEQCTADKPDANFSMNSVIEYPAMEVNEKNMALFHNVATIMEGAGMEQPRYVFVSGGADSSYISSFQIPVICAFGPAGNFNHTKREFIYVDSLFERIKLLALCITQL